MLSEEEFSKQVKERVASLKGGYTEFEGQNCDECLGWDGVSRRCQCGNRRVAWEEFAGFIYAEAY